MTAKRCVGPDGDRRRSVPGIKTAGLGSGGVERISGRASYRPDYKRLASGQVAAARAKLGLGHAEFAAYLGDLLGWTVTPAAVERWEQGSIPPGDVLLASAVAAQDMPGDVLTSPLNATAGRTAALLSAIGPAIDHVGDPTEAVLPYADRGLISRQQPTLRSARTPQV
jgi:transcriptional regulator with XRE-family HTH domain